MTILVLESMSVAALALAISAKLGIVLPLIAVCLIILILVPIAARLGILSIRTYIGLTLLGLVVGLMMGELAGANRVRGSSLGVAASVVFFVLIAVSLASAVSIFLFREPKQESTDGSSSQ